MADVFLSYSSKDRAAAQAVQQALTTRGFSVFWDQETPAGVDWDTWIRGKLSGARIVVVLWSRASISSQNVRHEAMIARDGGKLVPVMIEALAPSDFPMGLYLVQGISLEDWRTANAQGFDKLAAETAARLGQPAPKPQWTERRTRDPGITMIVLLVLLAAMAGGAAWWLLRPKGEPAAATPPPTTIAAATSCPGGAPPILGVCPSETGAAPSAPPLGPAAAADALSRRMVGRWRYRDDQACADGPSVTIESGQLVFTDPNGRVVHRIDSDTDKETRTTVVEGPADNGHVYSFKPEYIATSAARNFNLVVVDETEKATFGWTPCEVGSKQ